MDYTGSKLTELEFLKKFSEEAVYDDLDGYKLVKTKIIGEWRHGTEKEAIIQNLKTGKKFLSCYRISYDDCAGFYDNNFEGVDFEELKKKAAIKMKFLVFSDLHLNKFPYSNTTKTGENELLMSGLNIIDQVYNYAIKHGIDHIFFLGDLFHIRAKIDSDIYSNMVYDKFCKYFGNEGSPNLILVPGNHDQINKSGKHVLLPYSKILNVTVLSEFYKQKNIIICPHQYKIDNLYAFLEENSDENSLVFMHQLLMNSPLMSGAIFRKNEAIDVSRFKYKSIFSGHNHRPFTNEKLGVYNIGSPMHYDFGDAECPERYFISYDRGKVTWVETEFPHFAIHGSKEAKRASYVKKKSKQVVEVVNRVEINFNDDPSNIMKVYVDSTETVLDKTQLLDEGNRLFKLITQQA